MSDQLMTAPKPRTLPAGVLWGLVAGALVWALYFLQVSALDLYFWDVSVVPALALIAVVAGGVAVVHPLLRRFCVGLAIGAFAMLPLVLAAFVVLFSVLNLE